MIYSRMQLKSGKPLFSDAKMKLIVWRKPLTFYMCSPTAQILHLCIKANETDSKQHYRRCLFTDSDRIMLTYFFLEPFLLVNRYNTALHTLVIRE